MPEIESDQPSMTGDVKSEAVVRVPKKILSVIWSRSNAIEMAWRRRMPSSPEKCGRNCPIVNDWNTADGWFTARSPRSSWNVGSETAGMTSMTSTLLPCRSA